MRHRLVTALTVLSLPWAADFALANDPAPEGATATVTFKLTVKENTKSQWSSSALERVLNAQCLMEASPAMQIGFNGPSAEQEAAVNAATANAAAFEQQYAPSEDLTAQIEAEVAKCGEDEACMTAAMMKLSQNSEIQAMAQNQQAAKEAMAGLQPDLGPARYQQWNPKSCSGTLTVNDSYFTSDPGGEGGDGAFTDTTTVQGTAPIDPQALAVTIETDTVGNTTSYRVAAPIEVTLPSVSSMNGAGQRQVTLLGSTELPPVIGPLNGVLGHQTTQIAGPDGTVDINWQTK